MKMILLLLLMVAACYGDGFSQTPAIFDTDMGPDYDDVGAIALLHAFAASRKVKILATALGEGCFSDRFADGGGG